VKTGVQLVRVRADQAATLAGRAEVAGFDSVWVAGVGDNYLKAARLLDATHRVTVGTAIVPALLASPAFHAALAANLALESGGRFVLGLGSQTKGQLRGELGTDVPKIATQAREVVEMVRGLLSGEPFTYDGEFQRRPRPGWSPPAAGVARVPIYLSGVGPRNLRNAGRYADGFLAHPVFTARYFREVVWPQIDGGLVRGDKGREQFEMVAMPMTSVVGDAAERPHAVAVAKRNLAFYFSTRAYGTFMDFHGWQPQREALWEVVSRAGGDPRRFDYPAMEDCITDDMVDDICLVGSADEVRAAAARRYAGIADHLNFYPMNDSGLEPAEAQAAEAATVGRIIDACNPNHAAVGGPVDHAAVGGRANDAAVGGGANHSDRAEGGV